MSIVVSNCGNRALLIIIPVDVSPDKKLFKLVVQTLLELIHDQTHVIVAALLLGS
jgi:hypothetical protein